MKPLTLEFYILDPKAGPIDNFLRDPGLYTAYLKNEKDLSCCDFQGGYGIYIDYAPWNGDDDGSSVNFSSGIDEFWMTLSWLSALIKLSDGDGDADVQFWEESRGKLRRENDTLYLSDGNSFPEAAVSFREFRKQIIAATKKYLTFLQLFETELTHFTPKEVKIIREHFRAEDFALELKRLTDKAT